MRALCIMLFICQGRFWTRLMIRAILRDARAARGLLRMRIERGAGCRKALLHGHIDAATSAYPHPPNLILRSAAGRPCVSRVAQTPARRLTRISVRTYSRGLRARGFGFRGARNDACGDRVRCARASGSESGDDRCGDDAVDGNSCSGACSNDRGCTEIHFQSDLIGEQVGEEDDRSR